MTPGLPLCQGNLQETLNVEHKTQMMGQLNSKNKLNPTDHNLLLLFILFFSSDQVAQAGYEPTNSRYFLAKVLTSEQQQVPPTSVLFKNLHQEWKIWFDSSSTHPLIENERTTKIGRTLFFIFSINWTSCQPVMRTCSSLSKRGELMFNEMISI